MVRSILEPDLLLRVIRKKKQQLGEIEQDLENLPLDHPDRFRLFERKRVLEEGIPALEAEYANRTGEPHLSSGDSHSESTPVQGTPPRTVSARPTRPDDNHATERDQKSIFSADYRQVKYKGKTRRLTPQVAKILKVLDENKDREVTSAELQAKTLCKKISDSFRSKDAKPLWGHLVVATSKGRYKLNLPTSKQNPNNPKFPNRLPD